MLNVEILPHSADWRQVYLKIVAVYVLFLAYAMYFIFWYYHQLVPKSEMFKSYM